MPKPLTLLEFGGIAGGVGFAFLLNMSQRKPLSTGKLFNFTYVNCNNFTTCESIVLETPSSTIKPLVCSFSRKDFRHLPSVLFIYVFETMHEFEGHRYGGTEMM